MDIWLLLLVVFAAGAVGGTVNALLSDNGFAMPKHEEADGRKIWRPGWFGNVLVGGVSAAISWGLYGPLAAVALLGGLPSPENAPPSGLTLSALVGVALVGIAGSRWLTNEVDKNLLKASVEAAQKRPGLPLQNLYAHKPAELLRMVTRIPNPDDDTERHG